MGLQVIWFTAATYTILRLEMRYKISNPSLKIILAVTFAAGCSTADHYKITPHKHTDKLHKLSDVCVSGEELQLKRVINEYRASKGLEPVALSKSLTMVAQLHSRDQVKYDLLTGNCNMHSWGKGKAWTPCCYTRNHAKAACMWRKPKEIAGFQATGFEISAYGSMGAMGLSAEGALATWKSSDGHNNVIINRDTWSDNPWRSMGIGIYKQHTNVWWAEAADPNGTPPLCSE